MTRLVPHLIPPQYLAFLISLGDLDKARALAEWLANLLDN